MIQLLAASPYKEFKHIWVADSAYGSFDNLSIFDSMNCKVVLSVRKNFLGTTGALLDAFCTGKGSVSICNPSNFILTMCQTKNQNDSITNKFLLTNAVASCTTVEPIQIREQIEEDDRTVQIENVSIDLDGSYTKITMEKLSQKNLKIICETLKLTKTGTKKKLVDRIFNYYLHPKRSDDEVKLLEQIKKSQQKKKNILYKIYRRDFNAEDVFDKYLLKRLPKWKFKNWRSKLLITIILSQIINAWSMNCEKAKNEAKSLNEFIKEVALNWVKKIITKTP